MVTGKRQAARILSLYLKTTLRQDIEFFDQEITTGEVVGRMSGDTKLIQDALGEKVSSSSFILAQISRESLLLLECLFFPNSSGCLALAENEDDLIKVFIYFSTKTFLIKISKQNHPER